jgi:hypothetical protein
MEMKPIVSGSGFREEIIISVLLVGVCSKAVGDTSVMFTTGINHLPQSVDGVSFT